MAKSIVGIVSETASGIYNGFGKSLGPYPPKSLGPYSGHIKGSSIQCPFDYQLFTQLVESFSIFIDPKTIKSGKIDAFEYATTLTTLASRFAGGLWDIKATINYRTERDYIKMRNLIKKGYDLVRQLEKSVDSWIKLFEKRKFNEKKLMKKIKKANRQFHPRLKELCKELFGESPSQIKEQNPLSQ